MLQLRKVGRDKRPMTPPCRLLWLVSESLDAPSFGFGRTKCEKREGRSSHPELCSPQKMATDFSPYSGFFLLLTVLGKVGLMIVQVQLE